MRCRPAKPMPERKGVAEESGCETVTSASSPTASLVDVTGPEHHFQPLKQASSHSRWLEASPDCEQSHGKSSLALLNLGFHLKMQDKDILLTTFQLEFDAPNLLTRALDGDPTVRDDIEITLNAFGVQLRQENRSAAIFESLLRPYLSGKAILPLSEKAVNVLLSCCQQDEDPLAVLYGEAEFWGLTKLAEGIFREKNIPVPDGQIESPCKSCQSGLHPDFGEESVERGLEHEDIPALLKRPKVRLTATQRDLIRRYRASCDRVIPWLLAIREGPELARPSNSTYLKTLGWHSGTMFYESGPAAQRSSTNSEDPVQAASDADDVHKIEIIIKNDEQQDDKLKFDQQFAVTMSTEDCQLVVAPTGKGAAFHTCMQNRFGRHGLRIFYQVECRPSSALAFLPEILVIGYYRRGSLVLSSHPPALMERVLPEKRWTVSLTSPLCDDDFINGEVDIRIAFRLADPTEFWYLAY